MELKKINDRVSVSPQILVEDIAAIKQAGFKTIINNRPDGEAPDQPTSAEIKAAAQAEGIKFVEIPMGREGVSPEMIAQTQSAFAGDEPVLAYCRSGTRSTTLWALSQAGKQDAQDIIKAAANAGYDISHLSNHLVQQAD
ncbi:TIGR01244 family sulfur transferase [Maritalea porphyrae]|uniref:TIGR01244 family sulfur transferase n=1 Tax=Maritalea porphyrae TaxID=880732 RepID=UPI0022AFCCE1|nr:TIGR01244 family sulfur transferase [Maritalea porphyrae]MCZ4274200.1 TIGR01244 family sulfur transferase [Maritalea porphyrae]